MSALPAFPVTIPNYWSAVDKVAFHDAHLKNWLVDAGSLTERLQSHCAKFELQLIGQQQMQPQAEELAQLSGVAQPATQQRWQIREVILHGNGQPWVFARSVLPQQLCDMDLANLGSKPLGQIIFNDPRFKRQPFQLLHIPAQHGFLGKIGHSGQHDVWGRRSVFAFEQQQLMVAEVFLPQCPAYRQTRM